jgi:hypothetical protein
MLGIQIVGLLFGLFMSYYSFLNFKKKNFSQFEFFLWETFWILLMFITLFPDSLNFIIKDILSLSRPLDFFIIVGFLSLILLTYVNYNINKINERKVNKIISKMSILQLESVKNKSGKKEEEEIEKDRNGN